MEYFDFKSHRCNFLTSDSLFLLPDFSLKTPKHFTKLNTIIMLHRKPCRKKQSGARRGPLLAPAPSHTINIRNMRARRAPSPPACFIIP